ncbi:hypothetical protein GCM10028827_30670 [Mucilaginibacter myungsuensis]
MAQAQQVTQQKVEPTGVYKTIDTRKAADIIKKLASKDSKEVAAAKKLVLADPNAHIPPVLYALSNTLYLEKKFDDAAFWFYVAQLRARYDVNRCADRTATSLQYNQAYGAQINKYATKDIPKLRKTVARVIQFVKTNNEQYDQRWINLTGMDAMQQSLGDKAKPAELSVPKKQWPAIKTRTIKEYLDGFNQATADKIKGK